MRVVVIGSPAGLTDAVLRALRSDRDSQIVMPRVADAIDHIFLTRSPPHSSAPMFIDVPLAEANVRDAPRRGPERPVRPPAERVRGIARRKR